jgi:hypothetical protein
MYFIEDNAAMNEQRVKVYDIDKDESRELMALNAERIVEIGVRGNILAARDEKNVFVWNIKTEKYIGSYPSVLKSIGLSVDGNDLATLAADGSLTILKLCENDYHVYNPVLDQCQPCAPPCNQCFLKDTQCFTCKPQFFFKDDFSCGACLQNC